ncbi:MAG: hypothetical protein KIT57_06305 [Blastocatellales bacterium]|nr:hypothetical protein [Blastocatellales bacterium]
MKPPITETGYRSHFTTAHAVAAMGWPVALVPTWLDEEAESPAWQRQAAATRQRPPWLIAIGFI